MRFLLFMFSLAIIHAGCDSSEWEKLDKLQRFVSANNIDVEKFINSTLKVVRDTTEPSSVLLKEIDSWEMPWENSSLSETTCTLEFPRRDNMKELFLVNLRALQEPVKKRVEYLRKRLVEVSSSLSMLRSIAQFKNQSCSISTSDCHQQISTWLEEKVSVLRCKIVKHCQEHVITKRYINGCPSGKFKCRSGECIPGDNVCGGADTCRDGSDETPQCQKYCFEGFHCKNLKCLDKWVVCDGNDDCGDNSDEEGCTYTTRTPTNCTLDMGLFLCKNRMCIPLSEVCDGADGCGDGSDEGGLCGSGCPGRCSDHSGACLSTPNGPVCVDRCPPGSVDTASGCKAPPELLPATIEEQVEDMAWVVARYISSVHHLKQQTYSRLFKASTDFSTCYGDQVFNKITKLTNFNDTSGSNNTYILKND